MKRLTFKFIKAWAAARGISVERGRGRVIEYWRKGQDHTVGEASSVAEAWDDLNSF